MTCALCGSDLRGRRNEFGDVVCLRHSSFGICMYCLRPIASDISDCTVCTKAKRKGKSTEDLRLLVLDWYTRTVGPHSLASVPVAIVGEPLLDHFVHGMTSWQTDGSWVESKISLFDGLPEVSLASTLVHEYAHVVLTCDPLDFTFSPASQGLTDEECEGFCELMAHTFLGEVMGSEGARVQRRMLENGILVYSNGLKAMLRRVAKSGDLPLLVSQLTGRPIRRPDPTGRVTGVPVSMPKLPENTIVKSGDTRPPIHWREGFTPEPALPPVPEMVRKPIDWRTSS